MRGVLTTIHPDGSTVVNIISGRKAELEDLRLAIGGGYIEMPGGFGRFGDDPVVAICDEEGKLKGLPPNPVATAIWWPAPSQTEGVLVGDVCFVTGDAEFMEEL